MTLPNIIFIVLDTLRADKVLLNDNDIKLTPFMETLLNNSIYFKNCVANSPWTFPSHVSMFTGLYSTQNVILSKNLRKLSPKIPTLAEILKNLGYFTTCYTENPWLSERFGLIRGFDNVFKSFLIVNKIRSHLKNEKNIIWQIYSYLDKIELILKKNFNNRTILKLWDHIRFIIRRNLRSYFWKYELPSLYLEKNINYRNLEKFNEMLKTNLENKPLFFFFNIMTTHDPYIPLREAFKVFKITMKDFRHIKDLLFHPRKNKLTVNFKIKHLSNIQIKIINRLYNACVYSADLMIKKIFSILENHGLLKNSYVIITSDHGEHLGGKKDHYYWEHVTFSSVYKSLMQVPLIIYNKKFQKRVVEKQVQLKDLFHTILHITGITSPQNQFLELNKSILNQINNDSTPKYIFGDYLKNKDRVVKLINDYRKNLNKKYIPKIFNNVFFLRSNNYKYIKYDNTIFEEFYDLIKDSHEERNIFDPNREKCRKMKLLMNSISKYIFNQNNLKEITIKKEKASIENIIKKLRINGI